MIKLSFIIPAYNCASLVPSCLDNIYGIGLDESEFEVLVTDDCSTDNTVEVLEAYASEHGNLTVLRQESNHRQGAARNRGLSIARGRYITFVDADDRVMPDMLRALDEALAKDVDVYCGTSLSNHGKCKDEFKVFKIVSDLTYGEIYDGFTFCSAVKDFCGDNGTPWGYLFKLDKVRENGMAFIEDHLFEETDWIACQFLNAGSIFYSDLVVYQYLYNPDSVMAKNMGINYVVDSNKLAVRMMKLVEKYRDTHAGFVSAWNFFADRNLLSKGARFRFLIQYRAKDIAMFYRGMGKEDLAYLASNYNGSLERRLIYRHRHMVTALMAVACTANALQRRLRGMGAARTNFYA